MSSQIPAPRIGDIVPGYGTPVINERAVRASAGILFLLGVIAFTAAVATGSLRPLQPFGMLFLLDMLVRLTVGDRWSPTLALGRLIVRRQAPEWVGAPQKRYAWGLGFGLALISCASFGLLTFPLWVSLVLCGSCLSMLFVETAFGICAGCTLQRMFAKTAPRYCPAGTCTPRT